MAQVSNSVAKGLGVSNVPNTYMVGYSAYAGQFYFCFWTTPLNDLFSMSPQCTVATVTKIQCGGRMNIKINFDGTFWTIYNNNELLMNVAKGMDLETYYVGLSGSTGGLFFQQSITQWSFQSTTGGGFIDMSLTPFNDPEYMLYYGDAFPTSDGAFRITSQGSQAGAISYRQTIDISQGFTTQFIWSISNCDTLYDGADGFAFFASPLPTNNDTVSQSQGSGLGVQYMQSHSIGNVIMAAYSATFNEFYICNWTDPRPDLFRYVCYTVANPTPKFDCGSDGYADYLIVVSYLGNQLSLSVNGEKKIETSDIIVDPNYKYQIGISGSTGQGYFQQDVSNWSFRLNNFLTNYGAEANRNLGSATLNETAYIATLTNGPNQSGAAYSYYQIQINYKFKSSFTWTGSNCGGIQTRGFSHFFSRLPPTASQIQTTPDELGIGNMADVYMMGYDLRTNTLYICDWGAPPSSLSVSVCSSTSLPKYTCGTSLKFKMTYDSFTLKVYVDNVFMLARNVSIYRRYYFTGFTGITSSSYLTQQISNWHFDSLYPMPYQYVFFGAPDSALFFGSATLTPAPWGYTQLKLTNGSYSDKNAGLLLSPTPAPMKYGFSLGSYWNATNCDPVYNGGDGFALIFTKAIPEESQVLASNGTGLGTQQVPNVTMIGYSSNYNEFYICSWTSPLVGSYRDNTAACQVLPNAAVNPIHPQRLTCGDDVFFNVNYDGYNLRLTFQNTMQYTSSVDLVTTGLFPLDLSVPYYVGMSGSVGNGYYEQNNRYFYVQGWN